MSSHLLSVSNLKKSFPIQKGILLRKQGIISVLNGISFHVNQGEILGIVGESGCGKSTLSRLFLMLESATQGALHFKNQPVHLLQQKELLHFRQKVQVVFQDPFASLNPKLLVGTQIYESLKKKKVSDIEQTALILMEDVGLSKDFLKRYPHQLSGGQRQRVAIARALSAKPKLLLADEPVSSLDLSVQAQIINLLNRLRKEHGFTQVVISHDLAVVANLCSDIIVMKDGEIVERGDVQTLLSTPKNPYTKRLINATPRL